jgi:hypothetical protein
MLIIAAVPRKDCTSLEEVKQKHRVWMLVVFLTVGKKSAKDQVG